MRRFWGAVIVAWVAMSGRAWAQPDELAALKAELRKQQEIIASLVKKVEELESRQREGVTRQQLAQEITAQQEALNSVGERLAGRANLSGYYAFEYVNDDSPTIGAFRQHFLSFFVSKQINRWNFFSETEFEYAPHFDASSRSFSTADGEVKIEAAWAEYQFDRAFNVRVGKQLFPQYWQVYHYPNLTLSTNRPINTTGTLFPREFVGAMLYGSTSTPVGTSELGVGYKVYVANNQVPDAGRRDQLDSKAVGARLQFELPKRGRLRKFDVATDMYRGKLSNTQVKQTSDTIWGFDTQIEVDRLLVFGEYARGNSRGRQRYGYYFQPAVRLQDEWVAFYRVERVDDPEPVLGGTIGIRHLAGANFRPLPEIAVKAEYFRTLPRLRAFPSTDPRNRPSNGFAASAVVFF